MIFLLQQVLTGLASASALFLVASGLTIIFGVTRIVNFAHGSLYMLGAYLSVSLIAFFGRGYVGFWGAVILASLLVGLVGALFEIAVLRRIYRAPQLFQLLATFGLLLVVQDAALLIWGPQDLLGPRAPGLEGAIALGGLRVPLYDLFLIALAPLVLIVLWLLFSHTRWGVLIRAATQDQEMVAALGVNQKWLFTGVFFLGAALAGLGGAVQLPKGDANLHMDLLIIAPVFVVVVVGGMGSLLGAYLAALLISLIRVLLITNAQLTFGGIAAWQMELVSIFLVMALVLIIRPWGLLGRRETASDQRSGTPEPRLRAADRTLYLAGLLLLLFLVALPWLVGPYLTTIATEALIFVLFAASLQFLMGIGGIISFGHAAYFGLGAYGVGLAVRHWNAPMELALLGAPALAAAGALLFGWFSVRLSGVYLAMLTLAFAQIAWSIAFQWIELTGGDNGIIGIWAPAWASSTWSFYYFAGTLCVIGTLSLRYLAFTPFGYSLRAGRDSPLRAEAIGIDVRLQRWLAFTLAGLFAGLAGGLFAYLKGSVSPASMSISRSVDALVMVLLGGVQTLTGPIIGGSLYSVLKSELIAFTNYWRSLLGLIIILLVVLFPQGIAGGAAALRRRVEVRL